ncbi:ubiquinol-cytochrome-c reductase complex assembly factor 1 [Caerostris extrusa]|uniref:Ubiquinol-cytochrome-c reductase complex assembly factor 1 n=1 Tax=Caerostris extrusa TaxID=172846 RepID=A0AAV4SWG1_CAEEX|nr:ubiquinol-cytochrome-c reductase complex assembly factor 1 [Caerostris extrusa]
MWTDVELRLQQLKEIRRSARKKYLKEIDDQFVAALISYDESKLKTGLLCDDTVLAAAAWRTLYGFRPVDPRLLEAIVSYIRMQVDHLDSLNTEDIMHRGSVTFLPIKSIIHHIPSE